MAGHEDMINFMSSYQRQDKRGRHYHPRGMLCWYGCNDYGEMNGYIVPIKQVPDFIWIFKFNDRGFQKLKREQSKKIALPELFTRDPRASPYDATNIKNILNQRSVKENKRRDKDASSEKE